MLKNVTLLKTEKNGKATWRLLGPDGLPLDSFTAFADSLLRQHRYNTRKAYCRHLANFFDYLLEAETALKASHRHSDRCCWSAMSPPPGLQSKGSRERNRGRWRWTCIFPDSFLEPQFTAMVLAARPSKLVTSRKLLFHISSVQEGLRRGRQAL